MAGRSVVCLSVLAALAFLLLFGSGNPAGAVTLKTQVYATLSCNGTDGVYGTLDDSCVKDPTYGANGANLTADMLSHFEIPPATPLPHSNFSHVAQMGIPSAWKVATDKEIPDGALVGTIRADSTLGLFMGACNIPMAVTANLYDCTTANFEGVNDGCNAVGAAEAGSACNDSQDNDGDGWVNDGCPAKPGPGTTGREVQATQCANASDDDGDADPIIEWGTDGEALTYGLKSHLPKGCTKYPQHLNDIVNGVKPRARYYGFTIVVPGMAPTQIQFLLFSPEQLTELPLPEADMIDDLGYINYVILDNPKPRTQGGPTGSPLLEFCTPLSTDASLHGKTDGQSHLTQDVPPLPGVAGPYWVVQDVCTNTIDDNGDTTINEMCGIQHLKNPAAGKGIGGGGQFVVLVYSESYRDADGDTITNNEDECAIQYDWGVDANNNDIDDVCDPPMRVIAVPCIDPGGTKDCDGDGWLNQQDNCPLEFQPFPGIGQTDTDADGIGDACDNDNWDSFYDGPGNAGDLIWGLNGSGGGFPLRVPFVNPDGVCFNNKNDDGMADVDVMWDEGCTLEPAVRINWPNGRYLNDMPNAGICINLPDTDGDGWCDAFEAGIGPSGWDRRSNPANPGELAGEREMRVGFPPPWSAKLCEDGIDNDGDGYIDGAFAPGGCGGLGCDAGCSTPETKELDWTITSLEPLSLAPTEGGGPGDAPRTCTNYDYYDVRLPLNSAGGIYDHNVNGAPYPGGWVDDDGDTLANFLGAALPGLGEPNCVDDIAGDADDDGVLDAPDNCDNVWNPTQLDTDADGTGDACDTDDDADGITDVNEHRPARGLAATDSKNVCDPRNFDLDGNLKINVLDVTTFIQPLKVSDRPCVSPVNYSVCR